MMPDRRQIGAGSARDGGMGVPARVPSGERPRISPEEEPAP